MPKGGDYCISQSNLMLCVFIREVLAALRAVPVFGVARCSAGCGNSSGMRHRIVMTRCGDYCISQSNLMLCGRIGEILAALGAVPVFGVARCSAGCGNSSGVRHRIVMTCGRNLYISTVIAP